MPKLKKLLKSLYFQVLLATFIGILLGHFYPALGIEMKPLGDGFIKMIKMIISPIIFCTVVSGIASQNSLKSVGKIGGYAILYFEVLSTIALIIGLIMVNWLKPGAGMNIDIRQVNTQELANFTHQGEEQTISSFLLNIIPNTFFDAFAKGEILPILFIAILFGFALNAASEKGHLILTIIDKSSHLFFNIVGIITKVAPIGAFGAMAFTIGKYGLSTVLSLGKLMGVFYFSCLIFIFIVLGSIALWHQFSLWKFLKYIKEELLIVLGTSSSESAFPRLMEKLENLGVSKTVVGLAVPAGYSLNLDGSSIYLSMAVVFIAQATNTPLDWGQQITILAILLIASKGAAGVTGSAFIVLAATLSSMRVIPVEGLIIILGIDRFMSEARGLTNLIGNGVATIIIGKWCGEVNHKQLISHLNKERL